MIDSVVVNAIHSDTLNLDIDPEHDWPLFIADYLLSDSWIGALSDDIIDKCKKELKHF